MELEHASVHPPEHLTDGLDRAVFERVWRRVMPEDRPDCPFVLEEVPSDTPAAPLSNPPEEPAVQPRTAVPAIPEHAAEPAVPAPAISAGAAENSDVPLLGASSAVYGALLQRMIDHELTDLKTYQQLARRASAPGGKILSTIAADERRHAKRLCAAYFLISGVRYWPAERISPAASGTYLAALRERFAEEQRSEAAYLSAAEETADPCLRELYLDLAREENAHIWLVRGILEQL